LRLPQLTTEQRDNITDAAFKANALAKGLTIYNMTLNCVQYWDNTKWTGIGCPATIATAADITAADAAVCEGNSATLTASSSIAGAVFRWYDSQTSTAILSTGSSFTTPVLNASITYYVSVSSGIIDENLPGNRKAVTVTVAAIPAAPAEIAMSSPFPEGGSCRLTATEVAGATSYIWTLANGLTTNAFAGQTGETSSNSITVTGNTFGNYEVSVKAKNICESAATTANVKVDINPNSGYGSTPSGTWKFYGQRCFDIAVTDQTANYGSHINTDGWRKNHRTDFSVTPIPSQSYPQTGTLANTHTYTFVPGATITNLRFTYIDATGKVIDGDLTPQGNYSGTVSAGTQCSVTVKYRETLNQDAVNLLATAALRADLYAVYTYAGTERITKLKVYVQDAVCSGALMKPSTNENPQWMAIMAYNLGADKALDFNQQKTYLPTSNANPATWGDTYQWGRYRIDDTYYLRTSSATTATASAFDANGQPTAVGAVNYFIKGNPTYGNDWRTTPNDALWQDNTTKNNPCPAGWRMPSETLFKQLIDATDNQWVWSNSNTKGYEVHPEGGIFASSPMTLYLTATNRRGTDGSFADLYNGYGYYWTTTPVTSSTSARVLEFTSAIAPKMSNLARSTGTAVRCVIIDY
ncbi:MAG: hypothetical protein LBT04_04130, partial [Prevotellaceae bacterium]|jgi:uncharacterized protein (TIGR02145 family)|nr:hypothetical protein [Prevotellaceae bacterium]